MARLIDLSHEIEDGMVTYRGLPAPVISDWLSRDASKARYGAGTTFQIGRIELLANTGTYIDAPFHRYEDGRDVAGYALDMVADLPGVVVRVTGERGRAIDASRFSTLDVTGKAVLVHTGWDAHWRTDTYSGGQHPFLTREAAEYLVTARAALVTWLLLGDDSMPRFEPFDATRHPAPTEVAGFLRDNVAGLEGDRFRQVADLVRVRAGSFNMVTRVAMLQHPDGETATIAMVYSAKTGTALPMVEFTAELPDGRIFDVSNSVTVPIFAPRPGHEVYRF